MQNGDQSLPSIILAGWGLWVKLLVAFELHVVYFNQILNITIF